MTEPAAAPSAKPKPHGALGFMLDFGPLLLFFVAYKVASSRVGPLTGAMVATFTFMVAIAVAVVVSRVKLGRVSPMTWISAVLILGFGALTLWFHDTRFIQVKPTIIYAGFAALLLGGLAAGRPLLKYVFGPVFEGLSEAGWLKLSRNWGLFFLGMAILNEVVRRSFTFDTWLTIKVWGATLLSLVFAAVNVPMLLRHGFSPEAKEDPPIPPPSL